MLYDLLKFPAKLAIRIFCRNILINKPGMLNAEGPLLIAANHPNSFLDAIIIATLFRRPVHALARGDSFKNKFFAGLLRSMRMLPVYRISEGQENLAQNYDTFEKCGEIFKSNGIVLIFSEGRCVNEWKLRPLKKGTARLAMSCWQNEIPLRVLPAGINYQSFKRFGKNVQLNFGSIITEEHISEANGYGNTIFTFNNQLRSELLPLVVECDPPDISLLRRKFQITYSLATKMLLAIPAIVGGVAHAPFYFPIRQFSRAAVKGNDHYDSVLVGLLFILYPFYLVLIASTAYVLLGDFWWMLVFALPLLAVACVRFKPQF